MKKQTRDELVSELAKANQSIELSDQQEESHRKFLSSALGAPRTRKMYSDESVQTVYSWAEIYVELGKLIAKRDYVTFNDEIKRLQEDTCNMRDSIRFIKEQQRNAK